MILKKREKILALSTVGLLAVVVLYQGYTRLRGSHGGLQQQRDAAEAELERTRNRLKNAEAASRRLDEWRRRSLPSDSRAAQSLYQNWLLQLARDARFSDTKIDASQRRRRKEVFYALQFNLQAKTTLDGLTRFLYEFYKADHLHQILNLTVTPEGRDESLKVQMTFEALSLTSAKSVDALSTATSQRTLADIDTYQEKIAERDLFAAYRPPSPPPAEMPPSPPPAPRPRFDPVKFAYLTAVTSVGDRPEVWILARTTGDRYELREGDLFEIGPSRCQVMRIREREVEIEVDGARRLVSLGQNLREGQALPPTSPGNGSE